MSEGVGGHCLCRRGTGNFLADLESPRLVELMELKAVAATALLAYFRVIGEIGF